MTSNSADVLLPCPFCGGSDIDFTRGTARHSTIYQCQDCACQLETGETWDAPSRWNTRNPATADEIERLRAALQQSRSAVIEECAALIEQIAPSYYDQGGTYVNRASAAKAIRALSQESADDRT